MDSADWETAEAAFDAEWEQYERREGKEKMAADAGGSREPTAPVATAPKGGSTGFVLDTSGLKKAVVRETSSDASAAMGLTEDTASTLAILGVRGASAEALEDNIMGQVNAAAEAEREAAQKKLARAARQAERSKHDERVGRLDTEIKALQKQVVQLERNLAQLEGSREAADKTRRVLAARKT
jgi:phage shock protein A